MTLFLDIPPRFHAFAALWLLALWLIHLMRDADNRRVAECVVYEAWTRQVRAWVDEDTGPLHSLADLTPLVGEVLPRAKPEVDLLGEWFPELHKPEPPLMFDGLSYAYPVASRYDWRPAWATPTGAWNTVTPRQLEASPS